MICYTDGACGGNGTANSNGGFGVVVLDDNQNLIRQYQHFETGTTNNRQEMKAILWAMVNYGKKFPLQIYSDSAYAIFAFSVWLDKWIANDWKTSKGRTPENIDLIQAFHRLREEGYNCHMHLIKGHNGNKWNEMADQLATGKIKAMES